MEVVLHSSARSKRLKKKKFASGLQEKKKNRKSLRPLEGFESSCVTPRKIKRKTLRSGVGGGEGGGGKGKKSRLGPSCRLSLGGARGGSLGRV